MLAAWMWVTLSWAGPEEGVAKLVSSGEFEKAQKKCEDVATDAEAALREACAQAYLPLAKQQNTVEGWQSFIARWGGTSLEAEAREAEAGAALYAAGYGAKEADYAALLAQYPGSAVASALQDRMGAAAIRDAFDANQAAAVARKYPGHEQLPSLVERYLATFAHVELGDAGPVITVEPPAGVAPEEIKWSWVVRSPDGSSRPWGEVAEGHLTGIGLPSAFVEKVKKPGPQPFPACLPAGVPGELGLALTYDTGAAFVPAPVDPACIPTAPPAIFVLLGGRMSALSLAPGHRMVLPPAEPPAKAPWFPWRDPSGTTNVFAPLAAGTPVLAGAVVGQPMGAPAASGPGLFLLSPIAGGMPWYVVTNPPPGALTVPADFKSAPLPDGWSFKAGGNALQPGTASAEPVQVLGGATDWWLPAGEPRIFSRLFSKITGLNGENPAVKRARADPLPPAAQGFTLTGQLAGPPGSAPVELEALDKAALASLGPALGTLGITVTRAWRLELGPDAPNTLFEGTGKGGVKLRGLADTVNRAFVWVKDERAQVAAESVFAFRWNDRAYFAWTGTGSAGRYVEAVHYEGIGLVREFR